MEVITDEAQREVVKLDLLPTRILFLSSILWEGGARVAAKKSTTVLPMPSIQTRLYDFRISDGTRKAEYGRKSRLERKRERRERGIERERRKHKYLYSVLLTIGMARPCAVSPAPYNHVILEGMMNVFLH